MDESWAMVPRRRKPVLHPECALCRPSSYLLFLGFLPMLITPLLKLAACHLGVDNLKVNRQPELIRIEGRDHVNARVIGW
jgi:hypothetical protein